MEEHGYTSFKNILSTGDLDILFYYQEHLEDGNECILNIININHKN